MNADVQVAGVLRAKRSRQAGCDDKSRQRAGGVGEFQLWLLRVAFLALRREQTDTIKSATSRLFARMALGALVPFFDHGIAYHLRDLAKARYADGRLQLVRSNGEEVFRDTEIGHGPLMESFTPDDARSFAKRANEARARLR